ncbi:hypothetical protein H9Q16_07445 [Sulfitobacter sp. TSTF-M16]|uniref:Uncharacterized protein n=1 Tax=Sulfitobacter aestuariivivens TaxID=2766981 RepID=A0A927D5C9_9RHOB|nr:hypothetical protein [Sulfitobacter aestuariivivens]MBD3663752.1 hypothetical protein [Sulfitobacter aestuariivivens]
MRHMDPADQTLTSRCVTPGPYVVLGTGLITTAAQKAGLSGPDVANTGNLTSFP